MENEYEVMVKRKLVYYYGEFTVSASSIEEAKKKAIADAEECNDEAYWNVDSCDVKYSVSKIKKL